jgi:hypothetical protein
LVLSTALTATAADDSDRIDVEQDRRRARVLACFRVEDRRVAEREVASVHMLRVFVEQEPKVGGRAVSRSDGQEHVFLVRKVAFQYTETPRSAFGAWRTCCACLTIPELG